MAGEFKVNGVSFATESGGTLTVNNSKVRLPSSGNGIEDSSGNSVLSESGGNVSLTAKNATVTGDFVPSEPMMFRNKIINGAMQISQRGDATGVTTTTYGGPDRFQNILMSYVQVTYIPQSKLMTLNLCESIFMNHIQSCVGNNS